MRVPAQVLMLISLGAMGGCFVAPPYIAEPFPPPGVEDGGGSGALDAGSVFQEDAGSGPQTDAGDPLADTRPAADPSCPLDAKENDDSLEQARHQPASSHVDTWGPKKYTGLTACLGDEDWFRTFSDSGAREPVGAIVRWDPAVGSLEVDLLDGNGAPLPLDDPQDIVESRPGEARLLRKKTGGAVYIRVRASGGVSVPYSADVYSPFLLH